ncbi:response regulator transcription factor [Roseospira navarrensis]|uniref:LuxR family transcriptional regulator n=1 Tax=Roseospira navarrensis TaxID=140058 RepID=A0A7X1ZI32_9PROT|nr:response regulator transcription factor [Roseospira navarrensis]MQX38344.1 hypothetical protein [Roseospira navarrensis]
MVRVALATDIRLFRDWLADTLQRNDRFRIVASAPDLAALDSGIREHGPDIALVDTRLPEARQWVAGASDRYQGVRFVGFGSGGDVESKANWIAAGVCDVIDRNCSLTEFVETLVAASRHEALLEPRVVRAVITRLHAASRGTGSDIRLDGLTRTEKRILTELERGLANKEIACNLNCAEATVKNHLHSIYTKTGLGNRMKLAAWYRVQRGPGAGAP